MKLKLLVVAAFLATAASAQASLVFEPSLDYAIGTTKGTVKPLGPDVSSDNSEIAIGAKIGYKFLPGLWVALDPQLGFSGKSKSGSTTTNYTRTQLWADVGYDFAILRGYLGYAALNELKFDDNTKYTGGTSIKLGASVTFLPMVALNLEYHMNGYDKIKDSAGNETSVSSVFDNFKENMFLIGVALQFE